MFKEVDPKQSFPKLEESILAYWEGEDTFKKSIENRTKEYVFYDGPPFATGLPHYGHLLAGTLKDVVPRYFTMQGYKIERKWGWDCHGLPVENIVEKELNLNNKTDIERYGVDKFNESCRSVVLRYAEEWKSTVRRMGRWVDMENDYKTMNPQYMESIWWVFKSLWNKDLIYEGHKVVPYCPRCATPLSNFETNQGYADKQDPAITVKFELVDEPGTFVLAWTTTPWTIPSDLLLAVGPKVTYVKVKDKNDENYIMAIDRLPHYYKNPDEYEVVEEFLGKKLKGKKYVPPLNYYKNKKDKNVFTIQTADFVTIEDGTGVVHIAPFGEDDMWLLDQMNVEPEYPLDPECKFNDQIPDFKGMGVFEANPLILKKLKDEGNIVRHETYNHSYPFCWRCDTPLIYRPISTWFVKVEDMKDELLKNNQDINWIPDHIQDGRFGKWLEGARDWAISRNRYWGAPLPVWRCDCGEVKCIGSIEELEKLTGQKVEDLHKHKIDHLTFPCPKKKSSSLTFVRHGETDYNKDNRWQGSTDNELNKTGIKQAEELAKKLKGQKFDLIVSSPMKRAKKTAEIINNTLNTEMVFEEGLREQSFGDWEGRLEKDMEKEYETDMDHLRKMTAPNGESFDSVVKRVGRVLSKYRGKKVLIVGHGHVYFATLCYLKGKTIDEVCHEPHDNGTPYKIEYKDLMRRIPEVLDCWFESGSMPYAQLHYPFENKEKFENNFPAEYIAEGLDQTRGWFYTLHVLSNALFGKPAFQNCIVNGIVLAEDGQKMSKRLNNYPDPVKILHNYGADALRFYLMNSPVVKADDLRFSEKGVSDVVRNFILPIWNAYSFFVTYANIDKWKPSKESESKNKLDKWILAELNKLIVQETEFMNGYDLQKASNAMYAFVDSLTNWYIRRSRRRFWKSEDDSDKKMAYGTLFKVLTTLCQIIAPFTPFVSEEIYRNLTGEQSVHLSDYPKPSKSKADEKLMEEMFIAKTIVSLGLASRAKLKIKVRQPLSKVQVALADQYDKSLLKDELEIIKEELNVKKVEVIDKPGDLATVIAKPNAKLLGPKYGKEVQTIIQTAKSGKFERLDNGNIKVLDYELTPEEMEIAYLSKEGADIETEAGILVALDTEVTPELQMEGKARDLVRQIQELRKAADYKVDDRITVALIGVDSKLLDKFGDYIKTETLATEILTKMEDGDQFVEFEGVTIKVKK
ncbi:class I tRNA ligase family protein [Candidatus Peregrinibacteria bacterium]|nr:class I tRNA ligase family protein [Candidatus Peregrinibacteria bacterium]